MYFKSVNSRVYLKSVNPGCTTGETYPRVYNGRETYPQVYLSVYNPQVFSPVLSIKPPPYSLSGGYPRVVLDLFYSQVGIPRVV